MAARRSYGTGSVYVRTDAGGRETFYGSWWANGQRVNRRLGVKRLRGSREGLTATQAEEKLRELVAEVLPAAARGERLTLSDAGGRYRRHLEKEGRKRATLVALESTFRVWLDPHLGDKALDAITTTDVEDLIRTMEAADVGAKSIRNYIGTLSALYRFAMHGKRKWTRANPCDDVDLPKRKHSEEIHYLGVLELEALASAAVEGAHKALDRAMYLTAAMTGLRQGELLALRWQDVD